MDEIFITKGRGYSVKTIYSADCAEFQTIIEFDSGKSHVLESFKSSMMVLETHEHWCKQTGLLKSSFNASQVKKHLTSIA